MPGKITKARWKNTSPERKQNKLERDYEQELERQYKAGEIQAYAYEPYKMRLADNTTICPDFLVLTNEGFIEVRDCKGSFFPEKNRIKWKVGVEQHFWFTWVLVRRGKGGDWEYERF